MFALDSKEISYDASKKQNPASRVEVKSNELSKDKPPVVPCDSPEVKDSPSSVRESITFSKTRRGMLLRPAHIRKPSNSKIDLEKLSVSVDSSRKTDLERLPVVDSVNVCNTTNDLNKAPVQNLKTSVVSEVIHIDSCGTNSDIISIEKFEKGPSVSVDTTSEQETRKLLFLPFVDALLLYTYFIKFVYIVFLMLILFSSNLQATNQLRIAKGQTPLNL